MREIDRRAAAAEEDLTRAGVRDGLVELVEYDPGWPALYEAERERLEPLLEALEIHHIGSTAVPGLVAKPIIDMVALVDDLDAPIAGLIDSGYQYPAAFNATLIHRRFLCYPTASHRTHHLHLVDDRPELERRLRFRDRLRADSALAGEYAALKRTLAARYPENREVYTVVKAPFIRRVERQIGSDPSGSDSASGLVFRAAVPHDAEWLGLAVAEGFQSYLPFAPAGWTPRPASTETEPLRALLDSEDFWCLLAWAADIVLAGHIAFLPATRAWRAVEDPELAHLRQLFVAPAFWGTGLARTLHTRAIEAARERGFTTMRLFTPTGQARARRFYEREGWTVNGEPFSDSGFGGLELISYRRSVR
jgi:GrpB-like predicted nucleotidyltransferase (UPF0157 family)/ribosomal protein S18 acetylase RimI-like enzyme